ncbi:hypothetical protein JX266_013907 [Neoarthrinium moseri]|nr:hypothetical protein JX266_013907 [Neoarthrinium moseri]
MDPEGLREALRYTKSRDATAHTSTNTYLAPGFSSSCSQGEGLQISPDSPPVAAPDANERDHRPSSTNLNSGPHTVFNIAFQDASGISRYESGSSWGAFYAQLLARFSESHQHLLHLQPSAIETMADGRHVELAGSHANLPDRYLVEKAFDTFFSQVNVIIPILDYSQIYDMITTIYHKKMAASNATLMIIHLVLAVENHHRPHSLDTAFESFQATLEEGSQESVQAMTIMALFCMNRDQFNFSWVVIGCASKIAQSIGLHITTGCQAESAPTANPWFPQGYDSVLASLAVIEDGILRALSSRNIPGESDGSICTALLDNLSQWRRQLPTYLEPGCPTAPSYTRAIGLLSLRYYHCVMLLTRHDFLRQAVSRTKPSVPCPKAELCEKANADSIALTQSLAAKKNLSRSSCFDSFYILSNGIILMLRVLKNPSLQWVQELEAYLPILRRAEHLRVGSIGIRSFEALVASVKEAYEDLRHEPHLALADIALIFDQAIAEFLGPDGMADLTNADPLLLPDNQLE